MSAGIPLLGSDSPRTGEYDDYVRGTKHGKGCEPSSLLVQIGSNRRLYVLAALLVLLGAGLDALRAHSASGLARHGTFDTSKLAVLLEPRTEPVLVPVLHNFLSNLPPAWPVQVHTSAATAAHLRTSAKLEAHLASGKLSLVLLPNDGRDVHNGETLSKYLAQDSAFWDLLAPAEHILFFQTDSVLCGRSEFTVDDFLGLNDTLTGGRGYGWVGAVWPGEGYPSHRWGGNGGLSLRRRSLMQELTTNPPSPLSGNEDVWFVNSIAARDPELGLFPEQHTAMRFAFENKPFEAPMEDWIFQPHGIHLGTGWWPCAWGLWDHVAKLQEWCPEMNVILPRECSPHKEQIPSRA